MHIESIVSLTPGVAADPLIALSAPPAAATLVELRLDLFPGIDLRAAVAACPLPLLATLRSATEGGQGPVDPGERRALLRTAQEAGVALLDLEHARDRDCLTGLGLDPERIVLSWHDTSGTPAELVTVCEEMLATPARWIKVIPSARSLGDLQQVLALHRFNANRKAAARRLICFAMGVVGQASRYLAPLLGPPLTFVAWDEAAPAAPGQLTAARMAAVVSHLSGPPQRLYGVVGADVSGSRSPMLHAAGYRALGLPYLLIPVSVPDHAELELIFRPQGKGLFDQVGLPARGWAVTTPYKEAAAQAATTAVPRVRTAAAANTLLLQPNAIVAENTDADGVPGALRSAGVDPCGRIAVVQGTGGAARGAAVGLHLAGAEVLLRGRDPQHTAATAARLQVGWCQPEDRSHGADLLVNATPLGSRADDPSPFTEHEVAAAAAVVDMVYAPHTTRLAELAAGTGTTLADGLEILAHQGYAQFAAFTGKLPPREKMRTALRE